MSMSLREQLLAAGLVSKRQTKQIEHQERQQQHQKSKHKAEVSDAQKLAAQRAQAAKSARDQALSRQQQEKAQKKARRAEIMQLIEQNREAKIDSDDYYNFIDRQSVRRVAVNAALRERIARREVEIVRYKGHYELVPAAIAARIRERDEQAVVAICTAPEQTDENDPYKNFVVPDDLKW